MAQDQNREEPRFSRSGRVLKKTLKRKEMDDIGIKGWRQEIARSHSITPSKRRKLENKQNEVDEGRLSSSSGSLNLSTSSDTSCDDELSSTSKRIQDPKVTSSNPKTFARNRLNDTYSSDEDGKENTSEDSTPDNESGDKSDTCLKVNSKQLRLKKSTKIKYATFHKFPNIKYKGRRKNTVTAKKAFTKIKTSEHGIVVPSYYSRGNPTKIEDKTRMIRTTELGKSLMESLDAISSWNILAGYIERASLLHFVNSCTEINHKRPKRGSVGNLLDRQEHSPSSPVLGIAPIDVAAHLMVLGNCLLNIGSVVVNLDDIKPGVYSSLLNMLLCSVGPLLCLTRNIAGLETLPEDVFFKTLDHIGYIIPNM